MFGSSRFNLFDSKFQFTTHFTFRCPKCLSHYNSTLVMAVRIHRFTIFLIMFRWQVETLLWTHIANLITVRWTDMWRSNNIYIIIINEKQLFLTYAPIFSWALSAVLKTTNSIKIIYIFAKFKEKLTTHFRKKMQKEDRYAINFDKISLRLSLYLRSGT